MRSFIPAAFENERDRLKLFCTCRAESSRLTALRSRRRLRIVPLLSCCDARWLSPMEGTALGGRIVVGVDGSPASAQALRWALNQGALTENSGHGARASDPAVGVVRRMAHHLAPPGVNRQDTGVVSRH